MLHFDTCSACPRVRAGLTGPCLAQTTGHKRFCELAEAGDHRYDAMLCQMMGVIPPPSLVTQIVTYAGAMISHVAAGMPTLDDDQVEARLAICRECEWFDADNIACNVCKCGLLRKARMGDQHCPIGKW